VERGIAAARPGQCRLSRGATRTRSLVRAVGMNEGMVFASPAIRRRRPTHHPQRCGQRPRTPGRGRETWRVARPQAACPRRSWSQPSMSGINSTATLCRGSQARSLTALKAVPNLWSGRAVYGLERPHIAWMARGGELGSKTALQAITHAVASQSKPAARALSVPERPQRSQARRRRPSPRPPAARIADALGSTSAFLP
jgi:hypothetical protein